MRPSSRSRRRSSPKSGYVGRDVDTIIRDLAEAAVKQTREAEARKVRDAAEVAEERLLDVAAASGARSEHPEHAADGFRDAPAISEDAAQKASSTRDVEIEVSLLAPQMETMAPPGMEELTSRSRMFQMGGARRKVKRMRSPMRSRR
jgi:ATP-dependent HslUV protease ATP-binding subunit HslU